jgi:hypothetical protein
MVRGLEVQVDIETIARATKAPFGQPWYKYDKIISHEAKHDFLLEYKTMEDLKTGIKRTRLLDHWDEISLHK